MPKRKARPKKVTQDERQRDTELPTSSTKSEENACGVSMLMQEELSDGEGPSGLAPTRPEHGGTESSTNTSVADRRREFEAKYMQEDPIGKGAYGSVFAGYRREDNFPVAIKHIQADKVSSIVRYNNGEEIPTEVAVMLKRAAGRAGPVGTSVDIALLEWFRLDTELILVMERPIPAMQLYEYIEAKGGSLTEETAKVILKQLVEAAKELEDENIFHRDIHPGNILIETGSDVPRVRLIDFGLSYFTEENGKQYTRFCGKNNTQEWQSTSKARSDPKPTTVRQLGAVLYVALSKRFDFKAKKYLPDNQKFGTELSSDCLDFYEKCFNTVPENCPMLEDLLAHPWLS